MIKAFAIASNLKYGYQEGFGSMIFKLFDKKCGENDATWADTAEKVIKQSYTKSTTSSWFTQTSQWKISKT